MHSACSSFLKEPKHLDVLSVMESDNVRRGLQRRLALECIEPVSLFLTLLRIVSQTRRRQRLAVIPDEYRGNSRTESLP